MLSTLWLKRGSRHSLMRWIKWSLVVVALLLTSCSQKVYDLGVYRYSELKPSNYIPSESDINSSGLYRVLLEELEPDILRSVEPILKGLERVKLVDSECDYRIRTSLKSIRGYRVGELEIFNSRLQSVEKRVPIFSEGDKFELEKELKEFFKKKRGYILSKRIGDDNQAIFEISLGRNSGILKGDKVSIYDIRVGEEFLSGLKKSRIVKIASGKVSDKIYPERAWITLQKDSYKHRIGLGNLIIIGYNSFKDYLEDGNNLLENHPELLDNSMFK